MSIVTIFLLSFSLAADAFAVAIWAGIIHKKVNIRESISMAFSFGFFQALMPILWFLLASIFAKQIMEYDHWIAFFLLGYIGWNMISAWYSKDEDQKLDKNIFWIKSLLILGIATSIDALAVGVSLTASTDDIYIPAMTIWVTTFVLSFIWVRFGSKFWDKIWSKAEIIGGAILIMIGTKILIEHLLG